MATPDEVTKALLELRKRCLEMTITATTAKAHIMAVEATINAMGTRQVARSSIVPLRVVRTVKACAPFIAALWNCDERGTASK